MMMRDEEDHQDSAAPAILPYGSWPGRFSSNANRGTIDS